MFKLLTGFPAFAGLGIPPLPNLRDSPDEAVESHWVRVKTLLIQTFVYTHEDRYRLLQAQAGATLDAILDRHRRAFAYVPKELVRHARVVSAPTSTWDFDFDRESLDEKATDHLLAMCFLSYRSPRVVFPGWSEYPLRPNPVGYCRTVDYLISERKSAEALLLKGLFSKYGIDPMEDVPDLVAARESLVLAETSGISTAKQELTHLSWHVHVARNTGREPKLWAAPRARSPR